MSNRDADSRYELPQQAIPFHVLQMLKTVHTSLPGIVNEYDATTRRARVQPAVDLLMTDGTTKPKPILLDVPVLFPTGGGFTMHFPLVAGDPVMLLFAERDIAAFKEALEVGPPLTDDIMEIQHAVCVPGFVPPDTIAPVLAPPNVPGLLMQSNDGMTYVNLQEGTLDATVDGGDTNVHLESGVIMATPDGGVTVVNIEPGIIHGTPDMGTTTAELLPGAANVVAAAVAVTGNLTVTGDLAVTGVTTVAALTASGRTRVNDDLTVTGDTTVEALTANGDLDVNGNIDVTGDVDGIDVSTHMHGAGSLSAPMGGGGVSGSTGGPS